MNKIGTIFGIVAGSIALMTTIAGGAVWGLEQRFDERYVLVAESLQGKLLDIQEKIFLEKQKVNPNAASIEFWKLQEKQLKQKIEKK